MDTTSSSLGPLSRKPILLLDGGLGTTLEDNFNVKFDSQTPLWSSHLLISSPETLLAAQSAFATAGADIILTATYQASFHGFALTPRIEASSLTNGDDESNIGYSEAEAVSYMRTAVRVAREALDSAGRENGLVALSLGAYGATMRPSTEYSGKYDAEHTSQSQLAAFHSQRLTSILANSWVQQTVDVLAFETLPVIQEIGAAREAAFVAAQELGAESRKPFWISCVFPGDAEDFCLPDGSPIEAIIKALVEEKEDQLRPDGIGFNCTKLDKVAGLISRFEEALSKFIGEGLVSEDDKFILLVYPDGTKGEVYDTEKKIWVLPSNSRAQSTTWDETLYDTVEKTEKRGMWRSIIVGGCCKAAPADIAKLRKHIDN